MSEIKSRIFRISDIVNWKENGELEMSPKYQRVNKPWSNEAKSYLIDTIIRGLPIPQVVIRQKIIFENFGIKITNQEVIKGQHYLSTIIEFYENKFSIKEIHNPDFAGQRYSNLSEETKRQFLDFEISALIVNKVQNSVIYDMFTRLNSNSYVLNRQEIRYTSYDGYFKSLVYSIREKINPFFLDYSILKDSDFVEMKDAELINSMIILVLEGIVSETQSYTDWIYRKYDQNFPQIDNVKQQISLTMKIIDNIYSNFAFKLSILKKKEYFFTLYAVLLHQLFGIQNSNLIRIPEYSEHNFIKNEMINQDSLNKIFKTVNNFLVDYEHYQNSDEQWKIFTKNHKVKRKNKNSLFDRIEFLNNYFNNH